MGLAACRNRDEPAALSPELQVLLACIRDDPAEVLEERLQAVGGDDRKLLDLAETHWLTSLLWLRLRSRGLLERLDADSRGRLERVQLRLAARQTRMIGVALALVEDLAARGIRCLPLKGTAMIAGVWPEYLPRDMRDVDLLVESEAWPQLREVLEARGFEPESEDAVDCPWLPHRTPYVRGELGIEPHTALWGRNPLEPPQVPCFAELWERGREGALLDRCVRVPSPEDTLLSLLAGIAKDRFLTELRTWNDIVWLLSVAGGQADPERLRERARAVGAESLLRLALGFADDLLGTNLRRRVLPGGEDDFWHREARCLLRRRLLEQAVLPRVPRAALRLLVGGAGTAHDLSAAGRTGAREGRGLAGRLGQIGGMLSLVGGGLAWGFRLAISSAERRAWREERLLLRTVRG